MFRLPTLINKNRRLSTPSKIETEELSGRPPSLAGCLNHRKVELLQHRVDLINLLNCKRFNVSHEIAFLIFSYIFKILFFCEWQEENNKDIQKKRQHRKESSYSFSDFYQIILIKAKEKLLFISIR